VQYQETDVRSRKESPKKKAPFWLIGISLIAGLLLVVGGVIGTWMVFSRNDVLGADEYASRTEELFIIIDNADSDSEAFYSLMYQEGSALDPGDVAVAKNMIHACVKELKRSSQKLKSLPVPAEYLNEGEILKEYSTFILESYVPFLEALGKGLDGCRTTDDVSLLYHDCFEEFQNDRWVSVNEHLKEAAKSLGWTYVVH